MTRACLRNLNLDQRIAVMTALWETAPETYTCAENLGTEWIARMGYRVKLAGYEWREIDDLVALCAIAERRRVLRREGSAVARWHHPSTLLWLRDVTP